MTPTTPSIPVSAAPGPAARSASVPAATGVIVRRARPADVPQIRRLTTPYEQQGRLVAKASVAYFESIPDFVVAVDGARVVGCGALHIMWEDLAEIRTLAVAPEYQHLGIGHRIMTRLLSTACLLRLRRVFCLTFETEFFASHGFRPIQGTPVTPPVYAELMRSHDDGIAEFLDLARVKPNTLGNTRMLLTLGEPQGDKQDR
ncbi:MAG: amino-acid N-acetyltransferase [Bifidobacteriaceae bacterium]|jgi:amino-acid N-acetyltransferase|nr:amino-acid N-acetyltransferase [Bifidobacteriaceae bacterium]